MPTISVVIRAKNEEKSIGSTLKGLRGQDITFPIETLLIDSGSTDRTLIIAREYNCKIILVPQELFTYGYALNRGIKESSGEIICLLSAHCIPRNERWLAELVQPIVAGSVHATFGRQVPVPGVNPFEELSLRKHFPPLPKKSGRVPFSNANCAFLKEMWNVMPFNETLPGWEDYLWYLLLNERYIFQYRPEAAVTHTHPFSIKSVMRRTYNDGRAFGLIRDQYGIDIYNTLYPGFMSKVRMLVDDLINHVTFFRDQGYIKYIPLIPVVRFFSYFTYWKGLRSAKLGVSQTLRKMV